ncbi:nucleoside-diphosphate kinase [Actinoplanes sp. NPDC023936]|uniref:nucleoside-diphosphate kinase n=1 Tax=Actinoplanes sp. NPDC023936 TaxID=3154910 RepID=UPI0033DB283A
MDTGRPYHGSPRPPTEEPAITAFLLLKPDCLRLGLTGEAERAIIESGLRIERRRTLVLSPADTRFLWSEYTDDGHVLARAFLDRYLTTGPSEALLVSGEDAFEKARRVKRRLRSRHALGMFANVVHAAESPDELTRQRGYLFDGVTGATAARHRPKGMDFRTVFDVPRLVEDLWPMLQDDLPAPPPFPLDGSGESLLVLGGDRDHTLDSTVSAIWRALPGVDPAHAVLLALYADRTGGFPIAKGNRRSVARGHRALVRHGIRYCWQVSADEVGRPPAPRPGHSALPAGSAAPGPAATASAPPPSR